MGQINNHEGRIGINWDCLKTVGHMVTLATTSSRRAARRGEACHSGAGHLFVHFRHGLCPLARDVSVLGRKVWPQRESLCTIHSNQLSSLGSSGTDPHPVPTPKCTGCCGGRDSLTEGPARPPNAMCALATMMAAVSYLARFLKPVCSDKGATTIEWGKE